MAAKKSDNDQAAPWRPATQLVHGGTLRSQFGETSEAIFLNSGYVYDSAEQAEARFKGDEEGFVYSRYANPTVAMFEERMRAAGRRGGGARHGDRDGSRHRVAALPPQGRRPRGLGTGPVRELPLCRRGFSAALRRRDDAGRRPRPRRLGGGGEAEHPRGVLRDADQSGARAGRHRGRGQDRASGRRPRRGRQRVRHADAAAADDARRRYRGLFGDQAYRRPGPLPRRRGARREGVHRGEAPHLSQADRSLAQPLQCLGHAQGSGDAAGAGRAAERLGGRDRRLPRRAARRSRGCSIPGAPIIRKPRWRSGRWPAAARWSPSRSRATRRTPSAS